MAPLYHPHSQVLNKWTLLKLIIYKKVICSRPQSESAGYYLRRRICTPLSYPLTFGLPLCLRLGSWFTTGRFLHRAGKTETGRRAIPVLTAGPPQVAAMNQPCFCHTQHTRLLKQKQSIRDALTQRWLHDGNRWLSLYAPVPRSTQQPHQFLQLLGRSAFFYNRRDQASKRDMRGHACTCMCKCMCVQVLEDAYKPMPITMADKTLTFPLSWAPLYLEVCSVMIPEDLAAHMVSEWSLQFEWSKTYILNLIFVCLKYKRYKEARAPFPFCEWLSVGSRSRAGQREGW